MIFYSWLIFVHIDHILSQSSAGARLGGLHVLTTVNSDIVKIGVHVYFQINGVSFPDIYPGVELLDHVVIL